MWENLSIRYNKIESNNFTRWQLLESSNQFNVTVSSSFSSIILWIHTYIFDNKIPRVPARDNNIISIIMFHGGFNQFVRCWDSDIEKSASADGGLIYNPFATKSILDIKSRYVSPSGEKVACQWKDGRTSIF